MHTLPEAGPSHNRPSVSGSGRVGACDIARSRNRRSDIGGAMVEGRGPGGEGGKDVVLHEKRSDRKDHTQRDDANSQVNMQAVSPLLACPSSPSHRPHSLRLVDPSALPVPVLPLNTSHCHLVFMLSSPSHPRSALCSPTYRSLPYRYGRWCHGRTKRAAKRERREFRLEGKWRSIWTKRGREEKRRATEDVERNGRGASTSVASIAISSCDNV